MSNGFTEPSNCHEPSSYVVIFSALVMFTGVVSHFISSHVAKDCGAHKPTNPECSPSCRYALRSPVLALYATIDHFA